jgi:hypothetical protein
VWTYEPHFGAWIRSPGGSRAGCTRPVGLYGTIALVVGPKRMWSAIGHGQNGRRSIVVNLGDWRIGRCCL